MRSTSSHAPTDRWVEFERCRHRLFRIAFRMLGSADDAEDVVQEAALRWLQADALTVRAPEAWLVTVLTRLAVDHLRHAAREQRAWSDARDFGALAPLADMETGRTPEVASQIATAVVALREHLEPPERVAFVLREAFACGYDEIARVLDKSEVACRQVVHRARQRLRAHRQQFLSVPNDAQQLTERFEAALEAGDRERALDVLTEPGSTARHPSRPSEPLRLRRVSRAPAEGRPSWQRGVGAAGHAA